MTKTTVAVDGTIGIIDSSHWQPTEEEFSWMEANDLMTKTLDPDGDSVFNFRCIRSGGCCRTNLCELGSLGEDPKAGCLHLGVADQLKDGSKLYQCNLPVTNEDHARQIGKGCCAPWSAERTTLLNNYQANNTELIAKLKIL